MDKKRRLARRIAVEIAALAVSLLGPSVICGLTVINRSADSLYGFFCALAIAASIVAGAAMYNLNKDWKAFFEKKLPKQ